MIPYRHQQHLWQTSDGGLPYAQSQHPYTWTKAAFVRQLRRGQTWSVAQAFGNTFDKSTGDGQLVADNLSLACDKLDGNAIFAQLAYDSVARTWSALGAETVFTSTPLGAERDQGNQ